MRNKDQIKIVPAKLSDIPELHRIEVSVYPPHLAESPEVLASRIQVAPDFCAAAKLDQEYIAYILAHPWTDSSSPGLGVITASIPENADVIHLHDLAVLPQMQGKGVSRLMLAWLETEVLNRGFTTITLVAVNGADTFWTVMGFQDIGPATGYDAVARLMRRDCRP